jgi:hypothetical protein
MEMHVHLCLPENWRHAADIDAILTDHALQQQLRPPQTDSINGTQQVLRFTMRPWSICQNGPIKCVTYSTLRR